MLSIFRIVLGASDSNVFAMQAFFLWSCRSSARPHGMPVYPMYVGVAFLAQQYAVVSIIRAFVKTQLTNLFLVMDGETHFSPALITAYAVSPIQQVSHVTERILGSHGLYLETWKFLYLPCSRGGFTPLLFPLRRQRTGHTPFAGARLTEASPDPSWSRYLPRHRLFGSLSVC